MAASASLLPLALALLGCRPQPAPARTPEQQSVALVIRQYLEAYRKNDPDTIAGLYAPDAMLLPPGHVIVRGRDGIREFWSRGMEAGLAMDTIRTEISGRAGYVVGRYYVPPDENGDAETGKFVIALHREADGSWRITADIWNADDEDDEPNAGADSTRSVACRALRPTLTPLPATEPTFTNPI